MGLDAQLPTPCCKSSSSNRPVTKRTNYKLECRKHTVCLTYCEEATQKHKPVVSHAKCSHSCSTDDVTANPKHWNNTKDYDGHKNK